MLLGGILFGIVLALVALVVVSACILSSRISRYEESREFNSAAARSPHLGAENPTENSAPSTLEFLRGGGVKLS